MIMMTTVAVAIITMRMTTRMNAGIPTITTMKMRAAIIITSMNMVRHAATTTIIMMDMMQTKYSQAGVWRRQRSSAVHSFRMH